MKKRFLVFTVLASVMCANISMANLVANGTFDGPDVSGTGWNTGPIDGWNTTLAGHPFGATAGLVSPHADDPAPMSGQVTWFQANTPRMYQTFVGTKLLPNRIYLLTLDGYAGVGATDVRTLDATIIHATGSGVGSTFHSTLDIADMTDIIISNGTFLSGAAWNTARFNMEYNPADNAPSVYHSLQFTTPATLTDPNVGIDIGIRIGHKWVDSGQVKIDNVSVEVVPEPATFGFLVLLGLVFLRRK